MQPPSLARLAILSTLLPVAAFSQAAVYGTLSNFDVFNDTGQESHGFEIELDGISSSDVTFTFASPYIRYGKPRLVDFPGGVYVRYESPYDAASGAFTLTTPIPANITPTVGHSCWTGGAPGYESSGCEHFGVSLGRTPTATRYRWLVADPAAAGTLKPSGTAVDIASPVWSVAPAPAGVAPVVQAAIQPPRAPLGQYGNAVWVKVYENERPERIELQHLLTDDPVVPQAVGEQEVEWELSQSNPRRADGGELQHGKPLGQGNQAVIRRFEFYKYTGAYDPATHQALCAGAVAGGGGGGNGGGGNGRGGGESGGCRAPGPGELGDYIGAQMAAVQLAPAAAARIDHVANAASGATAIASGSWVSIYGTNLAPNTRLWQASDFAGDALPLALDGVSVKINGKSAAVYYISPTQLNVQAPSDAATGAVQVEVTNSSGAATGTATLQLYAPGFFPFTARYLAAVHLDGTPVAPPGLFGNAVLSRPAQPGEILMLFGTGFGPTAPAVPAGQIVTRAAPVADPGQLHLRIGGVEAQVQFAGIAAAGEFQFNVVVPALPDGDQSVVADIGGLSTQAGLFIAVKN